jgi:hypothetical protein
MNICTPAIIAYSTVSKSNAPIRGQLALLNWNKEEHCIPDAIDESEEELKSIETVVVLPEKRREIFSEPTKAQRPKIEEDSSGQMSLF